MSISAPTTRGRGPGCDLYRCRADRCCVHAADQHELGLSKVRSHSGSTARRAPRNPGILHMSVDPCDHASQWEMWRISAIRSARQDGDGRRSTGNTYNDHGMRWDNSGRTASTRPSAGRTSREHAATRSGTSEVHSDPILSSQMAMAGVRLRKDTRYDLTRLRVLHESCAISTSPRCCSWQCVADLDSAFGAIAIEASGEPEASASPT